MTELHVCSIPLGSLAFCADCSRAFDLSHRACPTCGTTCGWAVIPFGGKEAEQTSAVTEARDKKGVTR